MVSTAAQAGSDALEGAGAPRRSRRGTVHRPRREPMAIPPTPPEPYIYIYISEMACHLI